MAKAKAKTTKTPAPSPPQSAPAPEPLTTVADLRSDPRNYRLHPDRNIAMIAASLRDVGAARSIVIDEVNEVLAGNGVLEAAPQAGISKVQIVDVDGDTILAVRRRGLTPEQKRALAIYDNRATDLSEWNGEQLRADAEMLELSTFFSDEEVAKFMKSADDAPEAFKAVDENIEIEHTCPKCGYQWSGAHVTKATTTEA